MPALISRIASCSAVGVAGGFGLDHALDVAGPGRGRRGRRSRGRRARSSASSPPPARRRGPRAGRRSSPAEISGTSPERTSTVSLSSISGSAARIAPPVPSGSGCSTVSTSSGRPAERSSRRRRAGRLRGPRATATFFTLGWIAERYPQLVRRIADAGPRAREPRLRPPARDATRREASSSPTSGSPRRSSRTLPDARSRAIARRAFRSARQPVGVRLHRRGRLSLQLERLSDPPRSLRHARCAALRARGACRDCSKCRSRRCACSSRNWPAGGGGYFRLLPYAMSRWLIRRVNASTGSRRCSISIRGSSTPTQPRVRGVDAKTRFRHYVNLRALEPRLDAAAARLPLGPRRPRVPRRRAA